MKYSQLVQMPGDVNHWIEKQLKAYGIDGDSYTKYLQSLLDVNRLDSTESDLGSLDSINKCYIENIIEKLFTKIKETDSGTSSCLHQGSSAYNNTDTLAMDSNCRFSNGFSNGCLNCLEPIQPCLPPDSDWTRGLLHDSEFFKDKMDFSTFFRDNPPELFRFVEDGKNGEEDRVNLYNKQNLLASERGETHYEGNAEIDKLIAKFDANVEEIWRSSSESDRLTNAKYQTLFSQNILSDPYFHQYGSNIIWSFEGKENGGQMAGGNEGNGPGCESSFSHCKKLTSSDSMSTGFNVALSNVRKWSALDGQNNVFNTLPQQISNCLNEVVLPENGNGNDGSEYRILEGSGQEEEDLLTSAKTHFRPIRTEELGSSQTGIYADGTTFAISNDLEKVSFKRSESGLLYLEADADTPRKYMEFKEKEGGLAGKGDWESDASCSEEFVPKFRVRQSNEKCVQTDEIDEEQIVPTLGPDTDCESDSCRSEEDEFYFPGDEELAQNIVNAIEREEDDDDDNDDDDNDEEEVEEEKSNEKMEDSLEMSSYKTKELKSCFCGSDKDWNQNSLVQDPNKKTEWSQIWDSQMTCDNCQTNSEKLSTRDKFRFREELTQEGEQLLLDLSCLQRMYSNSDWCEDGEDDCDESISSDPNEDEAEDKIGNDEFPKSESSYPGKGAWWRLLIAKQEPAQTGRGFGDEENGKNDLNKMAAEIRYEATLVADARQTERKRRNSSSQKACNLYLEGQCRRPHCRFSHRDSSIPCPFYADASCMKGESCPLSHGSRRPLSL